MKKEKVKFISITGRKWFEKVNGNTYHSVKAWVNGELVVNVPFQYGYGDHYQQTALNELEKAGYLPNLEHYEHGGTESLYRYCKINKIVLVVDVVNVQRKKDLV